MAAAVAFPDNMRLRWLLQLQFISVIMLLVLGNWGLHNMTVMEVSGHDHHEADPAHQFASEPGIFIWSNDFEQVNPYNLLEADMLGEYVLGAIRPDKSTEFQMMFYDPGTIPEHDGHDSHTREEKASLLQLQNSGKEYYWTFFNKTGVLPSVAWISTTVRASKEFKTTPGNSISLSFALDSHMFHSSRLPMPPSDILIEIPANSKAWLSRRTFLELPSWGLLRWRLSSARLVIWTQIKNEIAYGLSSGGKVSPAPEFFRKVINPCAPDLFTFYVMTIRNESVRLYLHTPIVRDDRWIDLTPAFCSQFVNGVPVPDCGSLHSKTPIILTNDHILALTTRGLFVSDPLSGSDAKFEVSYLLKPLLVYKLIDPCVGLYDILTCFGKHNTVLDMKMHYTPVCHLHQHPNYRDTVILVIQHTYIGQYTSASKAGVNYGPSAAFTIIFADVPYNTWEVLVKSVHEYENYVIVAIEGIVYNYQQNHFDFVITIRSHGEPATRAVRIILPRPLTKSAYYTELNGVPERGFPSFQFPPDFRMKRLQVLPGSTDVFYYGNHLWVAESGGFLVYQALSEVEGGSEIKDCSFGHPDRYYVCTSNDNSILWVGRIGSLYAPVEMYPHEASEIRELAVKKKWILPIDKTWDKTKQQVFNEMNNNRLLAVLRNSHFSMTYGGNLRMWYFRGTELPAVVKPSKLSTLWAHRPVLTSRSASGGGGGGTSAEAEYEKELKAAQAKAVQDSRADDMTRIEINLATKPFITRAKNGPLVAMPVDATTCVLFEALVPETSTLREPTYLSPVHAGLNIRCSVEGDNQDPNNPDNCELYIRHLKDLRGYLPGFKSSVLTYVVNPIPMLPNKCDVRLHLTIGNAVRLELDNNTMPAGGDCWNDSYVGWTLFIPKYGSLILEGSNSTDCKCASAACTCVDGLSTKQTLRPGVLNFPSFTSLLIDMSTPMYKRAQQIIRSPPSLIPLPNVPSDKNSWQLELGECSFSMQLRPNQVIQESGGHVILDLDDTITFKIRIVAANEKARVMMQRPLLRISNSNPIILQVDRNYDKAPKHQELTVVVRPTGFGIGVSTVVIRTVACSMKCKTPCSFTIVFQLMRQEDRDLTIDYPLQVTRSQLLADEYGNLCDPLGNVVYKRLPVNYRPPSHRGPDIPLSSNIYNADPSKPRFRDWYRVSKQTGVYKQCKGAQSAKECKCSTDDRLSDHPEHSDCKQRVYVVRRGEPVQIKVRYKPLMNDSFQAQIFFLKKKHLSVMLQEINDRTEYSVTSKSDEYLRQINADRDLNLGRRYYDANSLTITCYGTGVFHFRAVLGRFDSFDHVSGYFILYSEENGMSSLMYLVVMLLTLTACFVGLFFAFLHIRGRLLATLPLMREEAPTSIEDRVERQKSKID